jgi:hypothetical protein
MPTTDDFYQKLTDALTKLDQVNANLHDVKTATDAVRITLNGTLIAGFNKLVTIGDYTNLALAHQSKQNDTMICSLDHIARNTCELLNQSAIQTRLQTQMQSGIAALAEMYATVHSEAALERERLQALKAQIEKCCPPPQPEPPCHFASCPAPAPLGEPPKVEPLPTPSLPGKVDLQPGPPRR